MAEPGAFCPHNPIVMKTKTIEKNIRPELAGLLAESDAVIREAQSYLVSQGVQYSLSEWVTPKEYARRFGLESTNVVSNWISRGIIPAENVKVIEDLNNLKLIKAIPYKG